jgi:hypothetical protein
MKINPLADPLDRLITTHYLVWLAFTATTPIEEQTRFREIRNYLALKGLTL